MKNFKKEIGEKIVLARKSSGMTQAALSKRVGVSQQVLSGYERGVASIPLYTFREICLALNVPLGWFLPDIKQYGDIVSGDDLELLRRIRQICDPKVLLNVLKSNGTKSRGKAKFFAPKSDQ